MDALFVDFPVSGVHTSVFLPPLVAFAVSFVSSMGGVSGAFFLLPYQVSVLHFVTPSVTSTNFVYNLIAIPSGVLRYIREGRMAWSLALAVIAGTLPGVFLGYYLRVLYLPEPRSFRLFVGCVLLYIAFNLVYSIFRENREGSGGRTSVGALRNINAAAKVGSQRFTLAKIEFSFGNELFSVRTVGIVSVSLIVGIVGGAYGIGGGSILAPFCVAVYRLPVYAVAGAALLGTFLTSVAGVAFYSIIPSHTGLSTGPDWMLGALFGLGGILGMYCGARLQRFVSQTYIKAVLALIMLFLSCRYILDYFTG